MGSQFNTEETGFRNEVRAFLQRELTREVFAAHRDHSEQGMWSEAFTKGFRRKLGTAGYIGMGWPREYGGGGRSRIYQTIFWDEMEYHRAPGLDRTVTYVPSAVMAFGSESQKATVLPQMSRGELSWFVGCSEREAGSDLANIKTRAGKDGDGMAGSCEVAIAELKCSQAIPALTRTAHQIHGAIAYYRDYPLEIFYHRAIAAQAAYGDAAHHRRALATMMSTDLKQFRGRGRHELPVHYF